MAYTHTLIGGNAHIVGAQNGHVLLRKTMNAKAVIAGNTTLTTNGKITASDEFQLFNLPKHSIVHWIAVRVIEAGTAGNTIEVGIGAGGAEGLASFSIATADAAKITLKTDAWGVDNLQAYLLTATDTIDVEYIADETVGEFVVYCCVTFLDN